jgi:hypothetical protein
MESLSYIVSLSWLGLDPSEMGIALFGLLPLTLPILMAYFMGKSDGDKSGQEKEKE